ncbi:MAG: peptide chain release factor 1 [Mycobacteriales bacterium]
MAGSSERGVGTPTDNALSEYAELEEQLADPSVHADQARARELGRRYAELGPLVAAIREQEVVQADLQAARDMAAEDTEMAELADDLAEQLTGLEGRIRDLLVPRDPADAKDCLLEVKAGEGGDESALFAGDLVRMYTRYAEQRGWKVEVISATEGELGGFKDIQLAVKSRDPADPVFGRLKYEGGVHRVQRVPVTESQGRIHTSAAGVLVLPEAEEVDVTIDQNDLRIDVYRSSGPGGQSVNTTDSAVRITHLPTGVTVAMQNEKSQLQNREAGMRVLRARLLALALEEQAAKDSAVRGAQIRTVDRSEKVRTYNFPDNRVADHRSGYKANNLVQVLDGDLDPVIASLVDADTAAKLAGPDSP